MDLPCPVFTRSFELVRAKTEEVGSIYSLNEHPNSFVRILSAKLCSLRCGRKTCTHPRVSPQSSRGVLVGRRAWRSSIILRLRRIPLPDFCVAFGRVIVPFLNSRPLAWSAMVRPTSGVVRSKPTVEDDNCNYPAHFVYINRPRECVFIGLCRYCGADISRPNYGTSGMRDHLKRRHPRALESPQPIQVCERFS